MSSLPKLDTDTLCYIIENKITSKDCEQILTENKQVIHGGLYSSKGEGGNDMLEMDENDLIISPAKFAYPKNS